MKIADNASIDDNTHGGGEIPPRTGLTPDALPEVQEPVLAENSQTGVSTRNAQTFRTLKYTKLKLNEVPHWYALRVTYGREKKAYDYFVRKHVEAYYPTIKNIKEIDGKRKTVEESRLPNIFFARGTEEEIRSFVYDNVNLPYLRFYYRKIHVGNRNVYEPLIVPENQMESLKIICAADADDIVVASGEVAKFKKGQMVRVIEGDFKGVTGIVARYHGQQRVAIVIDGLLTVCTAYIPSAFMKIIEQQKK